MDAMLNSRIGKLRIICSLPLFSDSICIRRQSAAEHGFTQVLLSLALTPHLKLTSDKACELIELGIFAELPKAYLGDPSYYLRQRHPEAAEMYRQVRGRLWRETEDAMHFKTTRSQSLYGLHELIDSYSSMLYIEKESLMGNSYFANERDKTHYHRMRGKALAGNELAENHPAARAEEKPIVPENFSVDWKKAVNFLDNLFDESTQARLTGGIGEYSSTFIGMMEKLKEHYRYKGWSYHYRESVGEHTFQVVFLARILASALGLNSTDRINLYRLAAFHDLAEAYASDVIYPVKIREKDLGAMHVKLEENIINEICEQLGITLEKNPFHEAIVDICDRFSAQIYFDREQRSGNMHFRVQNTSMRTVRERYQSKYPEVFYVLDELWEEFMECFTPENLGKI
jgi:5'-deoxynucleotidase YfbR-like HD superfamily hydrolase